MRGKYKNRTRVKVGVARGFGPRHAFNAQEGSEAVPSELPEPPPTPKTQFGKEVERALGQVAGFGPRDYAQLAMMLASGGEDEPEAISAAAVKYKDGRIETGPTHALITGGYRKIPGSQDGFLTSSGRFVNADEAHQIGIASSQLPQTQKGPVLAEDFPTDAEGNIAAGRGYARGKVSVAKGYGPRHAFNAQEGSEAVPSELPEPPPTPKTQFGKEVERAVGELAGQSPADWAKLAISLGIGGEELPGETGAVPAHVWNSWEVSKPGIWNVGEPTGGDVAASEGAIRTDGQGNHYQLLGSHTVGEGAGRVRHMIVQPVEAPGAEGYARGTAAVAKGYGPRHAFNAQEGDVAKLAGGESSIKPGSINDEYALPKTYGPDAEMVETPTDTSGSKIEPLDIPEPGPDQTANIGGGQVAQEGPQSGDGSGVHVGDASNWQLINDLGYEPNYPYGSSGSGVPTQKGAGVGGGVLGSVFGNLLLPGLGGIVGGKLGAVGARMFTRWLQQRGQGGDGAGGGSGGLGDLFGNFGQSDFSGRGLPEGMGPTGALNEGIEASLGQSSPAGLPQGLYQGLGNPVQPVGGINIGNLGGSGGNLGSIGGDIAFHSAQPFLGGQTWAQVAKDPSSSFYGFSLSGSPGGAVSGNRNLLSAKAKGDPNVGGTEGALTRAPARSTDTVPAMLTPREAVLNRNAAELVGRKKIRKVNAVGNKLAEEGVDLAAKGDDSVEVPTGISEQEAAPYVVPKTSWSTAPETPTAQDSAALLSALKAGGIKYLGSDEGSQVFSPEHEAEQEDYAEAKQMLNDYETARARNPNLDELSPDEVDEVLRGNPRDWSDSVKEKLGEAFKGPHGEYGGGGGGNPTRYPMELARGTEKVMKKTRKYQGGTGAVNDPLSMYQNKMANTPSGLSPYGQKPTPGGIPNPGPGPMPAPITGRPAPTPSGPPTPPARPDRPASSDLVNGQSPFAFMQNQIGKNNFFGNLGSQLQAKALANPVSYNTPAGTQPQQGFGWSTTPLPPSPSGASGYPVMSSGHSSDPAGGPQAGVYGDPGYVNSMGGSTYDPYSTGALPAGQAPPGAPSMGSIYQQFSSQAAPVLPMFSPSTYQPLIGQGSTPTQGTNSFYPPPNPATQPKAYQSGSGDIGSVPPNQQWQPQSLSAGTLDIAKLKQLAQRQGLTPQQTNAIVSQMAQLRAGQDAMSNAPGGASAWPEGTMSVAYQHGISEVGYPPFIGPNMVYHGDKGGWIGQMDPNYLVPRYWRGTGSVNPMVGAGALGLPGPVLGAIHRQRVGGVPMLRHTFPGTAHPTGMPPIGPVGAPRPSAGILPIKLG